METNRAIPTKDQIVEEIKSNTKYVNFFKGYSENSIESFIDSYARQKLAWLSNAEHNERLTYHDDSFWVSQAVKHLQYIQQKKLFDIQCLWRAEQALIPEIKISFEFRYWSDRVLNCPFIEPISTHDIEIYQDYLRTNEIYSQPLPFAMDWQDYEDFKDNDDGTEVELPDWYQYHNSVTGNGSFFLLPDIRGEKEERYRQIFISDRDKDKKTDKLPYLYSSQEKIEEFVDKFEDRKTKRCYKLYEAYNEQDDFSKEFAMELLDSDDCTEIFIGENFRETVFKTYYRYQGKKIAEYLPFALNELQLQLSLGMHASQTENEQNIWMKELRDSIIDQIIKGRIMNGEPGDLNF